MMMQTETNVAFEVWSQNLAHPEWAPIRRGDLTAWMPKSEALRYVEEWNASEAENAHAEGREVRERFFAVKATTTREEVQS